MIRTAFILHYTESNYPAIGYGLCTLEEFQAIQACLKAGAAETLQQAREALNDDDALIEELSAIYGQCRISDNSATIIETADFDPEFDYEDLELSGPNPLSESETFYESFLTLPESSVLWTETLISALKAKSTAWGHITYESPEVIEKVLKEAGYETHLVEGEFNWADPKNTK